MAAAQVDPQNAELVNLLTGMREGLDEIQKKTQVLTTKVKQGEYETKDGISYLDVKHFLLSSYCQHLVFAVLLRTQGKSLSEHPVMHRLAEIRLFLEKIRPVDKKMLYQIDKLLKQATAPSSDHYLSTERDDLKYKPNPDMLVPKLAEEEAGLYKPPKIAPTSMEEEESAKDRRRRIRGERQEENRASRSSFIKDLADQLEGRPEEIREHKGPESKEFQRMRERMDERNKQEENMFVRVPLSREERKKLKRLKRSRNGLEVFMDDFHDDVGDLVGGEEREDGGRSKKFKSSQSKKSSFGAKKSKNKFKKKRR